MCLKLVLVQNEVGTQRVEQHKQVVVAELDRGGSEKDRCFRMVAEKPHRLVRVSMLVADVVSFVDDHEIEARRWVEVQKPFSASSPPAALRDHKEAPRQTANREESPSGVARATRLLNPSH